jgi:alkanesulfonate monooxygenase SsuD/methylene tetrahydromethanopterin reductase-like flavin-dependent oxidoreductase (luciferase family)
VAKARSFLRDGAFKLGVFAANCSSGTAVTKVPERWHASWENNLALAKLADAAGLDFMLPIARWRGYGGETDFEGETLETITWACALLANTRRLTVFGTVHVPLIHPILAAKQLVTADHVGSGRLGLNIVCGWNQDEFDMFCQPQLPHDERYAHGQEWWDVVSRLWTSEEPVSYAGTYVKVSEAVSRPKPWGGTRPVVMNAGSSAAGRAFAARNCDVLFTALIDYERARRDLAAIRAMAESRFGRSLAVFTSSHVVCRPTRKEAEEYYRWYAEEQTDGAAVDRLMLLQGLHAQSYPPEVFAHFRTRFAGGHGSYPVIGSPDDVAQEYARIAGLGFAGATLAMVNYLESLPYFVAEVLPRLERAGVRTSRAPDVPAA